MAYTAKDLELDYFKIYDVANQQAGQVVGLQGQFDKHAEKGQLTYLDFFGTPASKNGEPLYDKNAHLTWYDLYDPTPDPVRQVTYANQFGKAELIIGRAVALLVPTWKLERGSEYPQTLDHYKIYQVYRGEPVNQEVKLQTQFDKGTTDRVYDPIFFGVPVQKWHEGGTSEIHNQKAHLVCYRIYPAMNEKTIRTRDQFSQRVLNLGRSVLLGAPSEKLAWKEID